MRARSTRSGNWGSVFRRGFRFVAASGTVRSQVGPRGPRVGSPHGRTAKAKRRPVARRLVRATAHRQGEVRLRARRCAARWFGFQIWFSLDNCGIRLLSGWPVFPDVGTWPGGGGLSTQSPRHTSLLVRSPDSSGYVAPYRRWFRHSYTRVCRARPAH